MLSKIDLLHKKFSRSLRGYSTKEVDLAFHEAAEAVGDAADENRLLAERIRELENELAAKDAPAPKPDSDLNGTLAAGRKIMDEIQENAKEEGQRITLAAHEEAARILAQANLAKARVYEEIAAIRARGKAFEEKMREVLAEHSRLLESRALSMDEKPEGDFTFVEDAQGKA